MNHAKLKWIPVGCLLAALLLSSCARLAPSSRSSLTRFVGLTNFSSFASVHDESGRVILLSPEMPAGIPWNELVVSWNARAPVGTFVDVQAAAVAAGRQTRFYSLGQWSADGMLFPRSSFHAQQDVDGCVDTDTLKLNGTADAVRLKITLGGTNGAMSAVKFLGLSFANTRVPVPGQASHRAAWGKCLVVPERSQHGWPEAVGWCSPASLSMVLAYWAGELHRPEMDLPVPQVAEAVFDQDYGGTGNWPFNTAFAGSFEGMRACVTRFDDLSEVEDWVAAGIPVILSARWDLLEPGRPPAPEGHLMVCVGFTGQGDVVANEPAANPKHGEAIRQVYRRENVIRAWAKSHNAVYLIYPESRPIPPNRTRHW